MKVEAGHQKRRVLEELLAEGMVLIALDARAQGVAVPEHLAQDPQLRLNLSYRFGLPMEVGIEGVTATLTFGGVPHACIFPWRAIFLMVCHGGGQPHLFPDDIPAELGYEPEGELDGVMHETPEAGASPPRPHAMRPKLSLVRKESVGSDDADVARPASPLPSRATTARAKAQTSSPRTLRATPSLEKEGPLPRQQGGPKSGKDDATRPSEKTSARRPDQGHESDGVMGATPSAPSDSKPGAPKRRGHLRVVK